MAFSAALTITYLPSPTSRSSTVTLFGGLSYEKKLMWEHDNHQDFRSSPNKPPRRHLEKAQNNHLWENEKRKWNLTIFWGMSMCRAGSQALEHSVQLPYRSFIFMNNEQTYWSDVPLTQSVLRTVTAVCDLSCFTKSQRFSKKEKSQALLQGLSDVIGKTDLGEGEEGQRVPGFVSCCHGSINSLGDKSTDDPKMCYVKFKTLTTLSGLGEDGHVVHGGGGGSCPLVAPSPQSMPGV